MSMTLEREGSQELESVLRKLRETWGTSEEEPAELLDEVIRVVLSPCPTSQDEDASPTEDTDHPSAHISLVEKMCELVGIAFDSSGVGSFQRTSGRLREQALDSLGAVVENARTNGKEAETSDVLDVVALGARDEKWFVRAAAGRVAMDAIRHLKSTEDFTGFSMSRHGCWPYALLVDEYPEVRRSVRDAFGNTGVSNVVFVPGELSGLGTCESPDADVDNPPRRNWSTAIVSAAVRAASEVLLSPPQAPCNDEGVTGEGDQTAGDVDREEESVRTALRCLRGISSLGPLVPMESIASAAVESLEVVEAWLAATLQRPPTKFAWGDGQGRPQGDLGDLGGSLFVECYDTARALASVVGRGGDIAAAATSTLGAFQQTCRTLDEESRRSKAMDILNDDTREKAADGSSGLVTDETTWQRLYCSSFVRLEAAVVAVTAVTPAEAPVSSPAEHDEERDGAWGDLMESLANALEEVPCAYERAALSSEYDEEMPANEKRARRLLGERIQRWIASCAQLLLRTGARICETRGSSPTGARVARNRDVVIHLLVSALPFEHACSMSDDPTDAWLACVRSDPPNYPSPGEDEGTSMPATAALLVAEPIPWDACVSGRRRTQRQHAVPATWASDSKTRILAKEFIQTCCNRLSLHERTGPAALRGAEGLVRMLRATARRRGLRENTGVGVKHAVAGAIRRLMFPLIAGDTLGHALPLVLPLADDYDPAHQALGFSLMMHIINQVTPSELSWHRDLLLEVLERGFRGGGRDSSAAALCLATMVTLLRRTPKNETTAASAIGRKEETSGRAGLRLAREALAQAGRTADGEFRVVVVAGASALLGLPGTASGYAPCEILRPALLCLLPILQTSPTSERVDARASTLRALHTLTVSCWPRIQTHAAKLLCALLWTCGDISRRSPDGKDLSIGGGNPADEVVLRHATRLGALVLVLSGESGKSTLREICSALRALRPAAAAMQKLAEETEVDRQGVESARD